MLGDLFKTSGEPMGNTQLGFTIACLLCSIMGVMGIMRIPVKSPPILAACACTLVVLDNANSRRSVAAN